MANDNADQTQELPEDGPWNMDPIKLSQTAGNTVSNPGDNGNGALVPDVDAPWALDGASLAKLTNNVKPDIPKPPPVDPSTQQQPLTIAGIFGKLVNTESGGKHFDASGNLLTSDKGAQGITQVMPKTGDSPGYGVKPLQDSSVQEYIRFGRDYLSAMLNVFGGNQAQAVAAYNAGPGSVQKAVLKAHEAGQPDQWLQFLPNETKKYVRKILG